MEKTSASDEAETPALSIAALRAEMGLSLEAFGALIGLASKGNVSVLERGGPCSLTVALALERLSNGRLDASALNADVAEARRSFLAADHAHAKRPAVVGMPPARPGHATINQEEAA